jgi:hydrogenase maturation factor
MRVCVPHVPVCDKAQYRHMNNFNFQIIISVVSGVRVYVSLCQNSNFLLVVAGF